MLTGQQLAQETFRKMMISLMIIIVLASGVVIATLRPMTQGHMVDETGPTIDDLYIAPNPSIYPYSMGTMELDMETGDQAMKITKF